MRAILVIAGNISQALGAVTAHHITSAISMVEDPVGIKSGGRTGCLTKVTVDGDHYSDTIADWLAEEYAAALQPGTLLRVKWGRVAA